jgi:hypothetical protein
MHKRNAALMCLIFNQCALRDAFQAVLSLFNAHQADRKTQVLKD